MIKLPPMDTKPFGYYWKKWLEFGQRVSNQVARVILMIIYYVLMFPLGIIVRLTSDFLELKSPPRWMPKEKSENSIESARRMF